MREKIEYPKVGVFDVARAMWRGLRPDGWLALASVLLFLIASLRDVFVPVLYKHFFDIVSAPGDHTLMAVTLIGIVFQILFFNTGRWIARQLGFLGLQKLEPDTMARLRQNSFDYVAGHSHSFFANNFTGSLIQKIGRFARSFERIADTVAFNFVPLLVSTIGAVIVTWTITPILAIVILVWVIVFFTLNYVFALWRIKYNIAMAAADSKTTGVLADLLTNQNAITLFATLKSESERFRKVTTEQSRITRITWNANSWFDSAQAAIIFIAEFFLFYFGIQLWVAGTITVGTFILVQVYVIQLSGQLWDFGRVVRTVYEVFADSKEMVEMLLLPHEIRDVAGARELAVTEGAIDFDSLSFHFTTANTVLNGIQLSIQGGEKVALVGSSGAGKTTIVRLLLRLHEVTDGAIRIDGQNIHDVTQTSLHRAITLVPQDPILFHRTLLENIRYGRLDATDDEVKEAARLAHCDEFISGLPLTYETYVGERGVKLSGGERQRIAIARAILKNAPILVLDEATSSLDSHSEALIQDALNTLMKGKTSIVIAHRLSTIRSMDRIVVLDGGVVTEDGTHDELLKNPKSLYAKLWNLQAGGFIPEGKEVSDEAPS